MAAALEPGDTLWTRTFGGSLADCGYSVQQTFDGGYMVAGYTKSFGAGMADVYLVKTDAGGDSLWSRTYGGDSNDFGYSAQQTTEGGYVIAGWTFSEQNYADFYMVKTDANGDSLWIRTYGGSDVDYGESVQQTTDGGYVVAGYTMSFGAGREDFYLVKTDSNGDTLWTRTYGGEEWEEPYSVRQTSDGGYIIAGWTYKLGHSDVYLVKTDADGDTLWTRTYGGNSDDEAYAVQQTSDGGYIVAGETESFGAGYRDVYLLKTDANGDTLWARTYGGSEGDYSYSVHEASEGGYIIAGSTGSFGAALQDVYLLRTDAGGDTLWTRTYGGSGSDYARCVQQTADGGYIVAGWTSSFGAGASDVWLLRVAGKRPRVSIEIVPDDPPVRVPQGGSFGFTGTLTNNTGEPQTTDIWTMAVGPQEGIYGPFKQFHDLPLDPFETRTAHFNQRVPGLTPLGFYSYIAYCGDHPSTVIDSSFFEVEVIPATSGGAGVVGWLLTGSFGTSDDLAHTPCNFDLLGNYPNPFNARSAIKYQLPEARDVKLEVYNLIGQKVATLVNGVEEAGYKSVDWDASNVSSGIYFYRLTAGDFTETKRMMLVK